MLCKLCSLWWKWELQQQLTKCIFSHGGRRTAVPHQSYNTILQVQALQPIRLTDLLITWGMTNKYQDWFYSDRTIKGSAWSSPRFFFKLYENKELPQDKMTQAVRLRIQKLQRKLRGNSASTLLLLILCSKLKSSRVYGVKECNYQSEGYGVVPDQSLSFLTFFKIHILYF